MAEEPVKVAEHAKTDKPSAKAVLDFHTNSDKDGSPQAQHHSLGPTANQAAAGNHTHDGGQSAALTALMENITVTGSKGGNAALASLLTGLAAAFGLKDTTT